MKVSDMGACILLESEEQIARASLLAEKHPLKYEIDVQRKRFYYIAYPPEAQEIEKWVLSNQGSEPSRKQINE